MPCPSPTATLNRAFYSRAFLLDLASFLVTRTNSHHASVKRYRHELAAARQGETQGAGRQVRSALIFEPPRASRPAARLAA